MSSYLRPRRGKKATAIQQSMILKKGEVFFEIDANGISTGSDAKACGKIKMGDGTTTYANLGYFIDVETTPIAFTNTAAATAAEQGDDMYEDLNAFEPNATVSTILSKVKSLLYTLTAKITAIQSTSRIPNWEYIDGTAQNPTAFANLGNPMTLGKEFLILRNAIKSSDLKCYGGKSFPCTNMIDTPKVTAKGTIGWSYMTIPVDGNYANTIDLVVFDSRTKSQFHTRFMPSNGIHQMQAKSDSTSYFGLVLHR